MSSTPLSFGRPYPGRSNHRPPKLIGAIPLEKRLLAEPVIVKLDSTITDRFESAPPSESRIQLLPQSEECWKSLKQEAAQSKDAFKNLETLAEQWIFPAVQKLGNKFSFIPGLRPLSGKAEDNTDRVAHNASTLINRYEEELDRLDPDTIQQATVELPGATVLPGDGETRNVVRDMTISALQRGYNYNFHRADPTPPKHLQSIQIKAPGAAQEAFELGAALGKAMLLTRHLVDAPANVCTTGYFTNKAKALAKNSRTLSINVLNEDALKGNHPKNQKRMGLLLAVGQGNTYENFKDYRDRQPRLVEMVHTPPNWDPKTGRTLLVVGKGVIFDTGGNNLKPTLGMHNMRGDMAGAASVLGLMEALDAKPLDNVRVVGLMPLTENRISGQAMLPQNIYQARSGKTVEIKNTDAEGRLILADAMNYGLEKYTANHQTEHGVLDIATLTGGKENAIGEQNAVGLAGNNELLLKSANQILSHDLRRQTATLLLNEKHRKMVTEGYGSGGQADAINSGGGVNYIRAGLVQEGISDPQKAAEQYAHSPSSFHGNAKFTKELSFAQFSDGAAFIQAVGLDSMTKDKHGKVLSEHKPDTPWLHFDIAGAEFGKPDIRHGGREWATGLGVADLYLTLQGISKGTVDLDPTKSVTQ
jgi:leucyl aminopeptidase